MDPTCQALIFFFFFLFFLSLIFFRAARPAGPPPPAAPGPPPPASPSPPASSRAADGRGIPRTLDPISEAPDRPLPAPCRRIPAFSPPAPDPRPPAWLRARASRPPAAAGEGCGRRWRSARASGAPGAAAAGRGRGSQDRRAGERAPRPRQAQLAGALVGELRPCGSSHPGASSSRPGHDIHPGRERAPERMEKRRAKWRRRTEVCARDGTQLGSLRPPLFGGRSQPTSRRNIPSWSQPNPLVFHPNSREDGSAPTRLAPLSNQTHSKSTYIHWIWRIQ